MNIHKNVIAKQNFMTLEYCSLNNEHTPDIVEKNFYNYFFLLGKKCRKKCVH